MKCLLIGNYGVGNFGDEAICDYFTSRYPFVEWIVLSAKPTNKQLPRLPCGVRSFFTAWWRTLKAYKQADAVIFGGGTLFTDIESVKACLLWWWHALPAIVFRKPIVLAYQGIGPFHTRIGEWFAHFVAARAVFISVRDPDSMNRIKNWNLTCKPIQTVDPVVLLINQPVKAKNKPVLGLIPRHNSTQAFVKKVTEFPLEGGTEVHIISFQPNNPAEQQVIRQLQVHTPNASIKKITTLAEAIAAISACSQVISQRLHGSIVALCLLIPTTIVTQNKNDKHSSIQKILSNIPQAKQSAKVAEDQLIAFLQNLK